MRRSNPLADDLDHILEHTRDLWDELRGQRIFITGGTGFVGCWLLESFAWANDRLGLGAEAVVLTRNVTSFRQKVVHLADRPSVSFCQGDILTFEFPSGTYSHVIHAAVDATQATHVSKPLEGFDTIVEGTRRALAFARSAGTDKFLFTSSGAVYGRQPPDMLNIPEDYSGGPICTDTCSPYGYGGEAKRAAEALCSLYAHQFGLNCKIARLFSFVGPYLALDGKFAVGNFIRDGLAGGPIRVAGDGAPYRSYLYAADLAIWLWTILFGGETCRPYNVGSGEAVTISHLAKSVADCVRPPALVEIAREPQDGPPSGRYVPSVHRSAVELGLNQTVELQDAICRTMRWHRARTVEHCRLSGGLDS
jgi:nucleoside-diphosphate-sugar epimerase